MDVQGLQQVLRFCIPQTFTAARVALSGGALFAAVLGQTVLAAKLLTLGAVTDGLDGIAARKLGTTSEFGALFDYFADYLCYIVVPVILSFRLAGEPRSFLSLAILGLPLLVGCLRYARNAIWLRREDFAEVGIPGLGTLIYAFFIITLVFLDLEETVGTLIMNRVVLITVLWLSCMMALPVRYPKLMKFKLILVPILVGFCVMTFAFTKFLAAIALALGFVYTVISPFFVSQRATRNVPGP
jgi:archaetidylserine synthase